MLVNKETKPSVLLTNDTTVGAGLMLSNMIGELAVISNT